MSGSGPRVLAVWFLLLVVQVYALPVPIQWAVVEISTHDTTRRDQPVVAEYGRLSLEPTPVGEIVSKTALVETFEGWFKGPWPDVPSEPIHKARPPPSSASDPQQNLDSISAAALAQSQTVGAQLPAGVEPSDRRLRNPAYQARFAHDHRPAGAPSPLARPLPAGPSARTLAFMALFLVFGVGVGWMYDSDSDDGPDPEDREPEL
ncbi:hypothetical protein C8Q70DRAFT_937079 [Cubamyces menziesii]|nr:hypothetical protein C8Q70DRAFT_937079 [Cubamyces menziesii]